MFGGGAGHIADMISRIKQNRELLQKKRYFKQHPGVGDLDFSKHQVHKLNEKKATKKQLQKIRDEAEEEQRNILGKRILILLVSVIITIAIFYYFNNYLNI